MMRKRFLLIERLLSGVKFYKRKLRMLTIMDKHTKFELPENLLILEEIIEAMKYHDGDKSILDNMYNNLNKRK